MAKKLIEEGFNDYRARVIPANAPDTQVEECRRAFMAGAGYLFHVINSNISGGSEVRDSDVQLLRNITQEMADWYDRMLALAEAESVTETVTRDSN